MMNSKNYRVITSEDNGGNKIVVIVKGELTTELITNSKAIELDRFPDTGDTLKSIVDAATIVDIKPTDHPQG